eukprot:TRINITY_DN8021_c0_g1_i1.p1 TRINITY_DN8021_c0_g1~~TRINITY_DN8021_c0_g1_i1.p1  ORF type:complete len:433 (-),score=45.73 TRINITY_DN8021_c0_g1_i1:91-1389(-)
MEDDEESFPLRHSKEFNDIYSRRKILCFNVPTFRVIAIAGCFFMLFFAFSTTQNYQTTINKQLGFWSLGTLYITFGVANLIAPLVLSYFSLKPLLCVSSIGYVFFIASNIYKIHDAVSYIASMLNGLGAAILWCAQSKYLVQVAPKDEIGKLTGIFFAIMQSNTIFGNLLVGTLYGFDIENWIVFTVLSVISFIASLSFLIIAEPQSEDESNTPVSTPSKFKSGSNTTALPTSPSTKPSVIQLLIGPLSLLIQSKFLILIPLIIYSGISSSFTTSVFTKFLGDIENKQELGYVMSCHGFSYMISARVLGHVGDKLGLFPAYLVGAITLSCSSISLLLIEPTYLRDNMYIIYLIAVGIGIAEPTIITSLYPLINKRYPDNTAIAFSSFRLVQSFIISTNLFIGPFLSITYMIGILSCANILGGLCIFIASLDQ